MFSLVVRIAVCFLLYTSLGHALPQKIELINNTTTAFVAPLQRGPVNAPTAINSWADFEKKFADGVTTPAVEQIRLFFDNGGDKAIIVRLDRDPSTASSVPHPGLVISATNPGPWGQNVTLYFQKVDEDIYNVVVIFKADGAPIQREQYVRLSLDRSSARYFPNILNNESELVRFEISDDFDSFEFPPSITLTYEKLRSVSLSADLYLGSPASRSGLQSLNSSPPSLVVLPQSNNLEPQDFEKLQRETLKWARVHSAFAILDFPVGSSLEDVSRWSQNLSRLPREDLRHGAIYYPALIKDNHQIESAGAVAGIVARLSNVSGPWKAPAGANVKIQGFERLEKNLRADEEGLLIGLGVNSLKHVVGRGNIIWGARTLAGAEHLGDEYRYISTSRTFLMIKNSLRTSLQPSLRKAVNTAPLRASVETLIKKFLQDLFSRGAFAGSTAQQSFFVISNSTNNSVQNEEQGILNVILGFSPMRPAEFVTNTLSFKTKPKLVEENP